MTRAQLRWLGRWLVVPAGVSWVLAVRVAGESPVPLFVASVAVVAVVLVVAEQSPGQTRHARPAPAPAPAPGAAAPVPATEPPGRDWWPAGEPVGTGSVSGSGWIVRPVTEGGDR